MAGIPIQVNANWNDGGAPIYGATNLSANNLYELDEAVVVSASPGTKHNFGIPVPANMIALILLVTGNLVGVSTYTFTTWAELFGAQATQLDSLVLTDGQPVIWTLGSGTNPFQTVTPVLSTRLVNGIANANTARLQLRVATS